MYVEFSALANQRLLTLQRQLGRAPKPEKPHTAAVPQSFSPTAPNIRSGPG